MSYAAAFASNAAVYPCAHSDLGTPPQSGCTNGYLANSALGSGTLLAANSLTARRGGFYNNREHAWVQMLNVNLHDLLAWNRAQPAANQFFDPNITTDGGVVIHLTVQGPASSGVPSTSPSSRYGVRVFGASDLNFGVMASPTGATVVSDQAIYIKGNYNVGTATNPKMPAAFMGDTINVLSSGWSGTAATQNDSQSRQPLAARNGAATARARRQGERVGPREAEDQKLERDEHEDHREPPDPRGLYEARQRHRGARAMREERPD